MYINMDVESSYWEDSKQSINIENNSYDGNSASRKSRSTSPQMRSSLHDDMCKEENSIYQYCDRNFNFSANVVGGATSEEDEYHHNSPKRKIAVTRDPMSHRIIEKRRRDRMNNCLADLSRLIPAEYLKKGRGRIEKTEIIEMAIKHMKFLQAQTCNNTENDESNFDNGHHIIIGEKSYTNGTRVHEESELSPQDHYRFGYQECLAETMHFLVELEGFFPSDTLCVKLINHLQKYYEKIAKGDKVAYRSPLESVGSPNTYETKLNGFSANSISDAKEHNGPNSVISTVHSDDSCQENGLVNSQLREMLVSPHINSLYVPARRPSIIRSSSPDPPSPHGELMNTDTQSSNGSLYKFKNYIKDRFSAEHSNGLSSSVCKSPTPSVVVRGKKRKSDFIERSVDSPSLPDVKPIEDQYMVASRPVPIFALHSKGSFYIPLTIDSNLLTPFLSELNYDYNVSAYPSMVLHPVTISVNFNRPSIMPSKPIECKPLLSPNLVSSRIRNGPLLIVPECR